MKLIVIAALALVAVAVAAPAAPADLVKNVVAILRSEFDQKPDGGYNFNFETADGTSRNENGELKVANDEENKPHEFIAVRGAYSFDDLEGVKHAVTYYADETGFHAESADLPVNKVQA